MTAAHPWLIVATHSAHELQEGIGQTGLFGEIFIGIGLLMGVGGGILLWYGHVGGLDDSTVGHDAAIGDAGILAFFLLVMMVGFGVFGALAILSGWSRHHDDAKW